MILKVSELDKYEQKKLKHDTRYGVDFQGKMLHPIGGMIYWYTWGEYTFDIRAVRKAFGKKECMEIDTDFEMHPCIRFQKIAAEIAGLVGDTPFLEVFERPGTTCA
jgi:hypothetical protein